MKDSENDCYSRDTHSGLDTYWYTTSVVTDTDNIAGKDIYFYFCTIACESLVNGIVDYLIHKMVKTSRTGGAYIHTGTHSDCFKTLKDLYLISTVILGFIYYIQLFTPFQEEFFY